MNIPVQVMQKFSKGIEKMVASAALTPLFTLKLVLFSATSISCNDLQFQYRRRRNEYSCSGNAKITDNVAVRANVFSPPAVPISPSGSHRPCHSATSS